MAASANAGDLNAGRQADAGHSARWAMTGRLIAFITTAWVLVGAAPAAAAGI
jgi:hypothetical protein